MPLKPRRARRRTQFSHEEWTEYLLRGRGVIWLFGLDPVNLQNVTDEMVRDAWLERGPELMEQFAETNPGETPYAVRHLRLATNTETP